MAQPTDGSTALFQTLTSETCVLNNTTSTYDYTQEFYRALKVLIISYPEKRRGAQLPPSYQNFSRYINEIQKLYGVKADPKMVTAEQQKVRAEVISVSITAKRMRGGNKLTNPKFGADFDGIVFSGVALDGSKELQNFNTIRIETSYDNLGAVRNDPNRVLVIWIEGDNWAQPNETLYELKIVIAHTHPEGYEQWFYFGRGVHLLINVEFKVRKEPNITPEEVSEFHMHTIYKMLERRLQVYGSETRPQFGHRVGSHKYKTTHRRSLVDPQTTDMFWSEPSSFSSLVPDASHPSRLSTATLKFIDLQIGVLSPEDSEESVCLCSEWCNWNAFFYYNPMYRFLLVRHYQLYMQNKTNLPNMYLCMSILHGCRNIPKAPILQLMNSANEFRRKYHEKYYLKSPDFRKEFITKGPNGPIMNALSYHKLKNGLDVRQRCFELNVNPLADVCIESLQNYYKVLKDLHFAVALHQQFITDRSQWNKNENLDKLGRKHYCIYIKQSHIKLMANYLESYDYLFTVDFAYTSRLTKTAQEKEIKLIRDNVMKKLTTDSPFNIRFTLNDFSNAFVSIYSFLSRVEPKLPSAHKVEGLAPTFRCYRELDTDFNGYRQNNHVLNFKINSINPRFQTLRKNFDAFYTLKLYYYLFEIQKHCIKVLSELNHLVKYNREQPSAEFNFIWTNTMIEYKYRNTYTTEVLFDSITNFSQLFTDFYDQFWKKADHEIHQSTNFTDDLNSGHFQYQRLYFWWNNGGNSKNKFTKIINQFIISQMNIINRTETLYKIQIIPPIILLSDSYSYYIEVFDQLMYYLIKANCSLILSTTANFFKSMHSLQIQRLINTNTCYSFCKPGWVPLFRTMFSLLTSIDSIRTAYIVFDDEFQRISNTCDQTQQMIKEFYRQFYHKLAVDWLIEIRTCLQNTWMMSSNKMAEFIIMHLAVGQSFLCTFRDHLRSAFNRYRKECLKLLSVAPTRPNTQHVQLFNSKNVFENYFKDTNAMRNAMAFQSEPWKSYLAQTGSQTLVTQMDNLNEQDVDINLNAANL